MKLDPDYKATLTNGRLTIDIPGTDSWTDMLNNVRIGRRKVHGCRVNRLDRAEALAIIRALREKIAQAKEIRIYGHSRGGAIALQVFWELLNWRGPNQAPWIVVTAAKPTGDRKFKSQLRWWLRMEVLKAYRHCGDIIPFLPPWQPNIKHSVFGNWQPFWKAHAVRNYREVKKHFFSS